eukprot:scaffold4883_cov119-Isochrysis_galbana.AAC.4
MSQAWSSCSYLRPPNRRFATAWAPHADRRQKWLYGWASRKDKSRVVTAATFEKRSVFAASRASTRSWRRRGPLAIVARTATGR